MWREGGVHWGWEQEGFPWATTAPPITVLTTWLLSRMGAGDLQFTVFSSPTS